MLTIANMLIIAFQIRVKNSTKIKIHVSPKAWLGAGESLTADGSGNVIYLANIGV